MSNRGLKQYTRQINGHIGDLIEYYVNPNPNDANLIIKFNMLNTVGAHSFDLGLIYNHQSKGRNDFSNGYGLSTNLSKRIIDFDGANIIVINADGSRDSYTYDSSSFYYVCDEIDQKIEKSIEYGDEDTEIRHYYLYDKKGNKVEFENDSEYPTAYVMKKGRIDIGGNITGDGGQTIIRQKSNGMYNRYTYVHGSLSGSRSVELTHNSNKYLTGLKYYINSNLIKNVIVNITTSNITIEDTQMNHKVEFILSNDKVTQIKEYHGTTSRIIYTISYGENKSTITDNKSNSVDLYFNTFGECIYEIDDHKNIIGRSYNDKKLLESSSSVFNFTKHQSYNKIPQVPYPAIFNKNNYILLTNEAIDNELLGLGASNKYRAYREGELSYTVSMDGNVKDTISIVLMGKLDTSYNPSGGSDVKVYLRTYYNQTLCDSVVKQFTGSFIDAYEFMFTGLSATKKFNKVKLQIILGGNISFYFSDILLLPKKAGSFLKYDTSYNLLGQTFGASTIGTIYNSKGQLKTYKDASNNENEITYDEAGNIIEVEQNGKSKKTYVYNSLDLLLSEETSGDVSYDKKTMTYNTNNLLMKVKDYLNKETIYNYNGLYGISNIQEATSIIEYTYNSNGTILYNQLRDLQTGALDKLTYEYEDGDIKKITALNGSVMEFINDNEKRLTAVKLNGTTIYSLTYTNDLISSISYGAGTYTFTYNSDDLLEQVKYNGTTIVNYEYDGFMRVNKITSNSSNSLVRVTEYTYNLDDQITKVVQNDNSSLKSKIEYDYDHYSQIINENINNEGYSYSLGYDRLRRNTLIYYTNANYYEYNNDIKSLFTIIPLNNSLNSISSPTGTIVKPSIFKTTLVNEENLYPYNIGIHRHTYNSQGNVLAYSFGNSTAGTIICNARMATNYNENTIFSMKDTLGNVISVRIVSRNVKVVINSTTYNTNLYFPENVWTFVAFSYKLTSDTYSPTLDFRVIVNTKSYINSISTTLTLSSMKTYIGTEPNETLPIPASFENLCFRGAYCEATTITNLYNNLKVYSISHKHDDLGLLMERKVTLKSTEILKNNYTYKKINNKNVPGYIESEYITTKTGVLTNRNYSYDNKYNVRQITDSVFGNKTYGYDYRGYLTNDNGTTITYEQNGNIKTYGSNTFTYDSTIKDKLIKYNNENINYYSNTLLVSSWGDYSFEYEGKRLKNLTRNQSDCTTYASYLYDENGLRISKEIRYKYVDDTEYESIKYYYNNGKLQTEVRSSNRLDYLYDENNQLYGFILNKTTKYFYVRDILGNILGIVDCEGNLVVKYNYNAYGEHDITGSNTQIGRINPFRYKGYYYDDESGFYYCKSRYYVVDWCRWLTQDSIDYIDSGSIGGINLFTYCNNNPVMYSDGSGHVAILTLLAVAVGVLVSGAITGLGSAMGREDDESFWGAFVGGFIDGAIGSMAVALTAAVPGVGGIIAGAGLAFVGGFVGNAVGQGISYGFDNIDFRASALQGGISALVNGFAGGALRLSGTVSGATNFARFIDASKISALGVGMTGYLTYYSFPSANKIRK